MTESPTPKAQREAEKLDEWRWEQAKADLAPVAQNWWPNATANYRRLVRENITPESGEA